MGLWRCPTVAVGACLALVSCSPPSQVRPVSTPAMAIPRPAHIRDAIQRGEVIVGMTPHDVTEAWGGTGCAFRDRFEGRDAEGWAFGRAPNGELVGITDCSQALVVVYFINGQVAGWATREAGE